MAIERNCETVYRVRRGFRGKAVLQRLINSPALIGGTIDASIRDIQWVDVDYDRCPTFFVAPPARVDVSDNRPTGGQHDQ